MAEPAQHQGGTPTWSAATVWPVVLAGWLLSRAALVVMHAVTPHGRVPLSFLLLGTNVDEVHRYAEIADAWLAGQRPPGAAFVLPFTILPRLLADDFEGYRLLFAFEMLLFDLATLLVLYRTHKRVGIGPAVAAAAFYVVGGVLAGPLLVTRCHPALGFVVTLAVAWLCARPRVGDRGLRAIGVAALALVGLRNQPETYLVMTGTMALLAAAPASGVAFRWAMAAAWLSTGVLAQLFASELADGAPFAVALRVLRDSALVLGAAALVAPAAVARILGRLAPPLEQRAARILLPLLFVWIGLASLSRVVENDLWWLMRVGRDVLADGHIPTIDAYSATALGRPFQAHEWLAGVLFYKVAVFTAGRGLSVLQAALALACAGLLVAAVPRAGRRSPVFVPALVAVLYVVAFRIDLRPHVLSLVGLAYLTFALERWRHTGSQRPLLALLPLQIVWVNLHGEAWLVPVLLAAVAAGAALESWRWTPVAEPRPLGRRDAGFLAALAGGTAALSLCNPYGKSAAAFAFRMGSGQRFMMQDLAEWQPTLSLVATHDYPFWAFMLLLVTLWASLLLRFRAVSAADASLALVATVLGLRCVRFTAELAVLTFPLLVRTCDAVLRSWASDPPRWRRPLFEASLLALLIAGTVTHGFAFNANHHRTLGLGFGGDLPYAHVKLMKARGLEGVVMNDYASGGLITFHLHPRVRPVMDSRIEVYGPALYEEYTHARESPEAFARYAAAHDVSLVLLAITPVSAPLLEQLRVSGDWDLLTDEGGFALLRRTGAVPATMTAQTPAASAGN